MSKINNYILIFFVFLISTSCFSQTKEDFKKQKNNIERKIMETKKLINKTKIDEKKSLHELNLLLVVIDKQQQLVKTLSKEIKLLQKQIKTNQNKITIIKAQIEEEEKNLLKLKKEYAKMVYNAFLKKGNEKEFIFIISSNSFNQAYKRIAYLKQYSVFRNNQIKKINRTTQSLEKLKQDIIKQQEKLTTSTNTKNSKISRKKEEIHIGNKIKTEKQEVVQELKKDVEVLKDQVRSDSIARTKLNQKIRKIIEEEIKKSRLNPKSKNHSLTPEASNLSSDFASNKGKLPWPLSSGVITQNYGTQNHPVFPGITTFNNGIDIATEENSEVRSVFDGFISRIFFIKGAGKAVLINHGEYFSVYSGLKEVSVEINEKILAKEKIGIMQTHTSEKKTELHFEIWKGSHVDPRNWLYNAD